MEEKENMDPGDEEKAQNRPCLGLGSDGRDESKEIRTLRLLYRHFEGW